MSTNDNLNVMSGDSATSGGTGTREPSQSQGKPRGSVSNLVAMFENNIATNEQEK